MGLGIPVELVGFSNLLGSLVRACFYQAGLDHTHLVFRRSLKSFGTVSEEQRRTYALH